jgi:hypothetical protein
MDKELLGAIGIAIALAAYGRYYLALYRGTVKPHLFSWLLWCVVMTIACAAQLADGGAAGAWVVGTGAVLTGIVAIYAYFRGEKDIRRIDWVVLLLGLSAIPLWMATVNPMWAALLVSAIDASGYIPTFRKSWHKPHEENALFFSMYALVYVFSLLALGAYNLTTVVYPATLMTMNIALPLMLLYRRRALKTA